MKLTVYFLVVFTLIFGCNQPDKGNSATQKSLLSKKNNSIAEVDTTKINLADKHSSSSKTWPDSLINRYINYSENILIRNAIKNKISEEWMFDQIIITDTAKYFIFQIGHDVSDSGETSMRFITDSWVYIDSLANTIYEYDLTNDRLIKWEK